MSGIIAGADMFSNDFDDYLKQCIERYGLHLKGFRQVLHPLRAGACLEDIFVKNVRLLGDRNLIFEVCIRPEELSDVAKLAQMVRSVTFVVNHQGCHQGIRSSEEKHQKWYSGIKSLGSLDNVCVKVSGLLGTWDGGLPDFTFQMQVPFIDAVLDAIPQDRLVYGSDYPVCNGSKDAHAYLDDLIGHVVAAKGQPFAQDLFAANARRIYTLQ